jgi:hypothetical protein
MMNSDEALPSFDAILEHIKHLATVEQNLQVRHDVLSEEAAALGHECEILQRELEKLKEDYNEGGTVTGVLHLRSLGVEHSGTANLVISVDQCPNSLRLQDLEKLEKAALATLLLSSEEIALLQIAFAKTSSDLGLADTKLLRVNSVAFPQSSLRPPAVKLEMQWSIMSNLSEDFSTKDFKSQMEFEQTILSMPQQKLAQVMSEFEMPSPSSAGMIASQLKEVRSRQTYIVNHYLTAKNLKLYFAKLIADTSLINFEHSLVTSCISETHDRIQEKVKTNIATLHEFFDCIVASMKATVHYFRSTDLKAYYEQCPELKTLQQSLMEVDDSRFRLSVTEACSQSVDCIMLALEQPNGLKSAVKSTKPSKVSRAADHLKNSSSHEDLRAYRIQVHSQVESITSPKKEPASSPFSRVTKLPPVSKNLVEMSTTAKLEQQLVAEVRLIESALNEVNSMRLSKNTAHTTQSSVSLPKLSTYSSDKYLKSIR